MHGSTVCLSLRNKSFCENIMSKADLTDAEIHRLLKVSKRITNPGARKRTLERHVQWDYEAESESFPVKKFAVFLRQSTRLKSSFSVGIRLLAGQNSVTLMRCNGYNHPHTNHIENERFDPQCHVHIATERYLSAGKPDDGFAEPTTAYNDLAGAFIYLVRHCNIRGIPPLKEEVVTASDYGDEQSEQASLFDQNEYRNT